MDKKNKYNEDTNFHIAEQQLLLEECNDDQKTYNHYVYNGEITRSRILKCIVQHSTQKTKCPSSHQSSDPSDRRPQPPSVQHRTIQGKNSLLLETLQRNDVERVALLLERGASPNATCRDSHVTACHVAALSDGDALALLLKAGADGQRTDGFGRRPLHLAAWAGRAGQVAALLKLPLADMTQHTEEVKKPRAEPSRWINVGCEMVVAPRLQEHESDNIRHDCTTLENLPRLEVGWMALHAACAGARPRCARLLLAAGADARARDAVGRTPLDVIGSSYYFGLNINSADFIEVIRLLRHVGAEWGDIRREGVDEYDTPLHTAVELGSLEAIEQLLDAGARVDRLNTAGQTAMHICVKKHLKEHLELLVNYHYRYDGVDSKVAAVDLKEGTNGRTVLHAAVTDGWLPGVRAALDAGASVSVQDNCNDFPIHVAANLGDTNILQEIISATERSADVDCRDGSGETALFIAVAHNHADCISLLLSNGAPITQVLSDNRNVLHVAAKHGNADALNVLLNHNDDVVNMINSMTLHNGFSPMYYAVDNNHAACVKLLLSKNASLITHHGATTCLHVAAAKNHYEMAKMIIEFDKESVQETNCAGRLPLEEAIVNGARDVIALLLRNGADLSRYTHVRKQGTQGTKTKNAIDLIIDNISKPTEFLEEVFDSFIFFEDENHQGEDCTVRIDYSILMPKDDDSEQKSVVKCLAAGKRQNQSSILLVHPLIESFIHIKWIEDQIKLYLFLFVYGFLLICVTGFITSRFYCKDNDIKLPKLFESKYWADGTMVLAIVGLVAWGKFHGQNGYISEEYWLQYGTILMLTLTPHGIILSELSDIEWDRHCATFVLLLYWLNTVFILSRFPDCGYYVTMFMRVAINVVKILFIFGFVLIGFTLSFAIQFKFKTPFDNPIAALDKTLVMMLSEFDYDNGFNKNYALRIIFLMFLILCSIVLTNLMLAVAVDDLSILETLSNVERLVKRIEFLNQKGLPSRRKRFYQSDCLIKWIYNRYSVLKGNKYIVLRRLAHKCEYKEHMPMNLREAIFERARQNEEKVRTAALKERLASDSDADMKPLYDMIVQMKNDVDFLVKMSKK